MDNLTLTVNELVDIIRKHCDVPVEDAKGMIIAYLDTESFINNLKEFCE